MKRKVAATSITLAAALVLAACGSAEPENPLSGLSGEGSTSVAGSNSSNVTNGDDDDKITRNDMLDGSVDVKVDTEDVEVLDDATDDDKERIEEQREENDVMGVNPESVSVPDEVREHFSGDEDVVNVDRLARDTMYVVDHGMSNYGFHSELMTEEYAPLYVDYMSEVLASEGVDKLERSIGIKESDDSPWAAWYIAPYRPGNGLIGEHEIASEEYSWVSMIDDVTIELVSSDRGGDVRDGVIVSMVREYHIPINDATQTYSFAMHLNLTMVPTGYGKWIASDWFTGSVSDPVLLEVEK